jgi:hypothetical protein
MKEQSKKQSKILTVPYHFRCSFFEFPAYNNAISQSKHHKAIRLMSSMMKNENQEEKIREP